MSDENTELEDGGIDEEIRYIPIFTGEEYYLDKSAFSYEPRSKVLALGFGAYRYEHHKYITKNAIQVRDFSESGKERLIEEHDMGELFFLDLKFSPDGKYLAAVMSRRYLKIWHLEGQALKELASLELEVGAHDISWRRDSKFLAASLITGYIALVDLSSFEVTYQEVIEDNVDDLVRSVAWRPDGKVIAMGTRYGYVILVEPFRKGVLFEEIRTDDETLNKFNWLPDGRRLIYQRGPWLEFADENGERVGCIYIGRIKEIAISPDGERVAIVHYDRRFHDNVVVVLDIREARSGILGERTIKSWPVLGRWVIERAFAVEWLDMKRLVALCFDGKIAVIEIKKLPGDWKKCVEV